jgi:transcription antitermination factor NusG
MILDLQWFCIQTNSQCEKSVAERLAGLDPYLPRFKAPTGRVKPLFPGYLFCPAIELWGSIRNTIGVKAVLMNGAVPARLPDRVISRWRDSEIKGLVQLPDPQRFHHGERLIVLRGTLKYRVVIHSGMSAKDRELVLIEMLGAEVKLSIASDDLVSEDEHARASLRAQQKRLIRSRARSF